MTYRAREISSSQSNSRLNGSEVILHPVERYYNYSFLLQLQTSKEFLICGVRLPNCESDEFQGEKSEYTRFLMYFIQIKLCPPQSYF